jgi:hypothetical protein
MKQAGSKFRRQKAEGRSKKTSDLRLKTFSPTPYTLTPFFCPDAG